MRKYTMYEFGELLCSIAGGESDNTVTSTDLASLEEIELNKERESLKQAAKDDIDRMADNMDDRQREFAELASALLGENIENTDTFTSTDNEPFEEIENKFDDNDYKTESLLYLDTMIKLLELGNDGYVKVDQVKVWVPSNYLLTALLSWKDEYEKM